MGNEVWGAQADQGAEESRRDSHDRGQKARQGDDPGCQAGNPGCEERVGEHERREADLRGRAPGKSNTYDKIEKSTMAYIRGKYKFTEAADKLLRKMVSKAGGKQAARTKKKAMK